MAGRRKNAGIEAKGFIPDIQDNIRRQAPDIIA
jgi:hypothetical protein